MRVYTGTGGCEHAGTGRQARTGVQGLGQSRPFPYSALIVIRGDSSCATGFRLQTLLHWPIVPFNYARCESEIARQMSNLQAQSLEMREAPRLALLSSLDDNLALGLLLI